MKECSPVSTVGWVLLVVGGVNWGLVGAGWLFAGGADWNVVHMLLGTWPMVEGVVYFLVGLAALWSVYACSQMCSNK